MAIKDVDFLKIKEKKLKKVKDRVNTPRGFNPKKRVTRADILEVLKICNDPKNKEKNVKEFLETVDSGVLTNESKNKILNDLDSYHA